MKDGGEPGGSRLIGTQGAEQRLRKAGCSGASAEGDRRRTRGLIPGVP
jgi:hypothetical protein